MTAYAIGQLTIHDSSWAEEYNQRIVPLLQRHGAQVLAKGQPQRLEGTAALPHVLINIAFPSADAARGWYNDAENQELVQLRNTGSSFELLLLDAG
ncbi:MAG: DUF1330 domain-containing protein [Pseudomonadales bacterium]|nr:DUF1330 domain-containing protein [Pseudomonadales bacterium]